MRYRFITILHFLKLNQPDCEIPLDSGIISNKHSLLDDTLSYHNRLAVGTLGVHSIDEFEGQTFYLIDGDFEPQLTQKDIDLFGTQLTFAFLRQIQHIAKNLWLVRDNSVYVRDGFLFVYDKKIDDGTTFKASLGAITSFASTNIEEAEFSKEEVLSAAKNMDIFTVDEIRKGETDYKRASQFQYFKSAKFNRKMYADIYVFFARSSFAIPLKILMYVSAMEALVSTSSSEISHQVSERVALLLGKEDQERLDIYATIKKAYNFRSKAAHGEAFKGNIEDTFPLLVKLDDYLRQMMQLEEPLFYDQQKMDEFFLKRLMSLPNSN